VTDIRLLAQAVRRIWRRHSRGWGAVAARRDGRWIECIFPIGGDGVEDFFARYSFRRYDLYYCPSAFSRKRRLGMYALPTPYAHCDIDAADPALFKPPPTLLTTTSPGRYQGIWEFATTVEAVKAEAVSRTLTREYGGDPGGWSSTKMLRVAGSFNHKDMYDLPVVSVVSDFETPIKSWPKLTSAIEPKITGGASEPARYDEALKRLSELLRKSEPLVGRRMWLEVHVMQKRDQVFKDGVDRSHILHQMGLRLRDLGMSPGECFALLWRSGWNKFRVDGRRDGEEQLRSEIAKIYGSGSTGA
jgi:hypothetical protein